MMIQSSLKTGRVKEFSFPGEIDYSPDLLARCIFETTSYHRGKSMTPVLVKKMGDRLHVKANLPTLVVCNLLGVDVPYMEIPDA